MIASRMVTRSFKGLAAAVAVMALIPGMEPGQAQSSFAPGVEPDQWQELSPDSRNEMRRRYLDSLPRTKREKLRTQAKRFNSLSSPKKQELCRRFQKDRGYLPPACQKLF